MRITSYLFIASSILLASCGGEKKESLFKKMLDKGMNEAKKEISSKPKKVHITDIYTSEFDRNETLIFEGYIGQLPSTVSMSGGKMNIKIYERRNQTLGNYVNLGLTIGTGKNEVESLPEKYTPEDLHVFADDKTQLGIGDKIRITATDIYTSTGYYSLEGYKIEKIEDENIEKSFASRALTQACWPVEAQLAIASTKSPTLTNAPRRTAWRVSSSNHRST